MRELCRKEFALIAAVGCGLLLLLGVRFALAAANRGVFHATIEQLQTGVPLGGRLADAAEADGRYRIIREGYTGEEERSLSDDPKEFTTYALYTNVINFTPYTMPDEGGVIYRIAAYIAQTGTTKLRVALYDDFGGAPRKLLAESAPMTISDALNGPGWLWFDIAPQLVPGGARYWLAYQADRQGALLAWKSAFGSNESRQTGERQWGSFPSLAGATWGDLYQRACYGIAYTVTHDGLDVTYTLPVSIGLQAYTLTVRAATSGEPFTVTADGDPIGRIGYTPTTQMFFWDDMEGEDGDWEADGFSRIVTDAQHTGSPTHAWWTDDVLYSSTALLTSPPISLPFNSRDMELRFWMRMNSEPDWDGGWLEYRTQDETGEWSAWTDLQSTQFIQGGYNYRFLHFGGYWGWTGTGGFVSGTIRVEIPQWIAGRTIQWRWRFRCDDIGNSGLTTEPPYGWWIDDVRIVGTTSPDTEIAWPLRSDLVADGAVAVRFQGTRVDSYPDRLGIDSIAIVGFLPNYAPAVTVTVPNGGEYLSGTQALRWLGSDANGDLVTYILYLSTDNSNTWTEIGQITQRETGNPAEHSYNLNTGAFSDTAAARVRIQATDDEASKTDESDGIFTIDNTPPTANASASPIPNAYGWNNSDVTVSFTCGDNLSGIASCSSDVTLTSEGMNQSAVGTATDRAGNSAQATVGNINIDKTPPTIDAARSPQANTYGWNNGDVTVSFTCGDNLSGIASCGSDVTLTSEGMDQSAEGTATDRAGNSAQATVGNINIDKTPPTMTGLYPAEGRTISAGMTAITATLADMLSGIDVTSIDLQLDGSQVSAEYDTATGVVSYTPSAPLTNETHTVALMVLDRAGNSVSSTWDFAVDEPPTTIDLVANPERLIANGLSTATITATVRSASGHLVRDGYEVVFTTTSGNFGGRTVYTATTRGGLATVVLTSASREADALVGARAGDAEASIEVPFVLHHVYLPLVAKGAGVGTGPVVPPWLRRSR